MALKQEAVTKKNYQTANLFGMTFERKQMSIFKATYEQLL